MPGPPRFDAARGDHAEGPTPTISFVPRERMHDTPGASSSTAGPVRLKPGPSASLPPDLAVDPTVAHIPATTHSGHAIM